MFIVSWIARMLIARKVKEGLAGPLAWGVTIAGALALAFLGWRLVKRAVISDFENEQRVEQLEKENAAINAADRSDSDLEMRDKARTEELEGVVEDAARESPGPAASAAGPVTNAVLDRMRADSQRRKAGREPGDAGPKDRTPRP